VCRVAGGLRGFFMPRSIILRKDEKDFAKNLILLNVKEIVNSEKLKKTNRRLENFKF